MYRRQSTISRLASVSAIAICATYAGEIVAAAIVVHAVLVWRGIYGIAVIILPDGVASWLATVGALMASGVLVVGMVILYRAVRGLYRQMMRDPFNRVICD